MKKKDWSFSQIFLYLKSDFLDTKIKRFLLHNKTVDEETMMMVAGGRGGELSSFDTTTTTEEEEEEVVLKEEEEDLEDTGGRGRRNSLRDRFNKIVQTTAINSWSLMRHLKTGGGKARSTSEEEEEEEEEEDGKRKNTRNGRGKNLREESLSSSVPKKIVRYFRAERRRTLTALTLLTAFPPILRASVEVSGTRILDYMVTTVVSLVVLLSMSLYNWEREVYPAMKMLLFAGLVVAQLLAENVCVALITHLDENKFVYTSLQDNLYQWLRRGCETSRALSELFCGTFPGWTTLHFGAWVILGVLGPTLGGEGEGLVRMLFKKNTDHQKALSRDERPLNGSENSRSNSRDEERGEKRAGRFVDKSPNAAFSPAEEQIASGINISSSINSSSSSTCRERSVFGIAARTCATIALARAIRVVSFMLTVVPNPKPGCYNRQFSDAPRQYEDGWHLIEYGSSRIRGTGGCNDLIFSGHGVIYMSGFLCLATHGISLGSFVVFLAVLHASCKEALDQTHYGVDMFLAIAVTALSWRECHTVETWVTGNSSKDDEIGKGRGRGEEEEEEEEKKRRGKFQLSKRARRGLSFCLPFLIIALVIAGATVFITSDA